MEDDFLANSLVIYIEREIAKSFDLDSILDDFVFLKDHKMQFYTLFFFFFVFLI
jgi:hypothetical protein